MELNTIAQALRSAASKRPLASALRKKRDGRLIKVAAREAKIHMTTFRTVERGQRPNLKTFVKLMAWLEIPPKDWHAYMRSWK